MCYICNTPAYIPCNCNYTLAANCDPCGTNKTCETKTDAACVFYNLYGGINNLININLPNNTDLKTILDRIDELLGNSGGDFIDKFVRISDTDSTSDYLIEKIIPGDNITFTQQNIGFNENIEINALNNKVSVNSTLEPDYLINQVIGGTDGIVINTILETGGKVQVQPSIDIEALLSTIINNSTYLNLFCQAVGLCPTDPCNPPSNLSVSFTNVSSVISAILTWVAGGGGGTQAVEYKLSSASSYTLSANVADTVTTNTISGLLANRLYNFRITNNCTDDTATSIQISGAYIECPTITLTPSVNFIDVSFPDLGGDITSYLIQLFASNGTTLISSQSIGAPFFSPVTAQFSGLNPATTYKVKVIPSINGVSNTTCSQQTVITENPPACLTPTNLVLTPSPSGSVEASWTPQSGILSQEVYYTPASGVTGSPSGNGWAPYSGNPVNPSTSSVVFTGLTTQSFCVAVRSICQYGSSPFTQTCINYVPQNVSITIGLPNTQITNVTGITGFTFVGPISSGGNATGSHSGFTGIIGVTLTGSALFTGNISLSRNNVTLQVINIPIGPTGTTYNFNSQTYQISDLITISVNI